MVNKADRLSVENKKPGVFGGCHFTQENIPERVPSAPGAGEVGCFFISGKKKIYFFLFDCTAFINGGSCVYCSVICLVGEQRLQAMFHQSKVKIIFNLSVCTLHGLLKPYF